MNYEAMTICIIIKIFDPNFFNEFLPSMISLDIKNVEILYTPAQTSFTGYATRKVRSLKKKSSDLYCT